MKGKGWITGPALEIAFKVKGSIKAGDEIYCASCSNVHVVAAVEDNGALRFDVEPQDKPMLSPDGFAKIIKGWRPKQRRS